MLIRWGFEVNENKTKFISNTSRQMVTGLTVNEKVSIPKDYKQKLRQEVYYALKFGLDNSIMIGNKKDYIEYNFPDVDRYYNHLIGKLNYVLQVEPENKWFCEARERLKNKYIYNI